MSTEKQSWYAHFIVLRSSVQEVTYAIVKATISQPELRYELKFKAALVRAITSWVEQTQEGKSLWIHTNKDLNLGDLSAGLDPTLLPYLAQQGIEALQVDTNCGEDACYFWTYDNVLANPK